MWALSICRRRGIIFVLIEYTEKFMFAADDSFALPHQNHFLRQISWNSALTVQIRRKFLSKSDSRFVPDIHEMYLIRN